MEEQKWLRIGNSFGHICFLGESHLYNCFCLLLSVESRLSNLPWWNVFAFCHLWTSITYFWSLVIGWLGESVIGEEPKKKKKAFNQLKSMCNSLAWNLEAASHDKFPLHNNGLQLLWIKFLPYRSKKDKHKIWYFILRKDFPNPNHH